MAQTQVKKKVFLSIETTTPAKMYIKQHSPTWLPSPARISCWRSCQCSALCHSVILKSVFTVPCFSLTRLKSTMSFHFRSRKEHKEHARLWLRPKQNYDTVVCFHTTLNSANKENKATFSQTTRNNLKEKQRQLFPHCNSDSSKFFVKKWRRKATLTVLYW